MRSHTRRILMVTLPLLLGLTLGVPATSMFTGFDDENPATGAMDAEGAVTFDENPAAAATRTNANTARSDIHQQTRVTANSSTTATGPVDVTQNTATRTDDRITYRSDNSFDNIYVTQDARSDIHQDCRTDGSCTQNAESGIEQYADIRLNGRFTNVFLTQRADSRIHQDCVSGDSCRQQARSDINQDADFASDHWSNNGFVSRGNNYERSRDARIR